MGDYTGEEGDERASGPEGGEDYEEIEEETREAAVQAHRKERDGSKR